MHTPCAGFSKHETGIPPGARYQVSGTGYLAPGTRDRINTEGRIPSTEDRARTLGNASTGFAGNRDRRLPHLRRQAVGFPSGEMRRKRIDPLGQVDGLLPHLQILRSPHNAPLNARHSSLVTRHSLPVTRHPLLVTRHSILRSKLWPADGPIFGPFRDARTDPVGGTAARIRPREPDRPSFRQSPLGNPSLWHGGC
jgi:hypothetical protein